MLSVVVESDTAEQIVRSLLTLANVANFTILVADGSLAPHQRRRHIDKTRLIAPTIIVYDQENGSVGDAVAINHQQSGTLICPAIPVIEAWLFADSKTLFDVIGDKSESLIGRMPLPEQILYPKQIKNAILRKPAVYELLLKKINVTTAGSRSPSLKYFLQSARKLSGLPPLEFDAPIGFEGQLNREVLRNLISEVYPSTKPLFRSASGTIVTADRMMQEITDGTSLGREYSSDILRVARDLLARQAKKSETPNEQ